MRILTVRQPWAYAIIHGGKDVENRTTNIAGAYRGAVAIHAGAREDTSARQHPEIIRLAADRWWADPASLLTGRRDQFGHIIGVVDIVDVHSTIDCWGFDGQGERWCSVWAQHGMHHLVLANPRPLSEPIPYRGALGLRRLDEATISRIEAQL
ncbi:hypothetical protein IC744_06870 [Microbacterium hominis]|nr:hypothetical protein IC745_01190 [Microbacterium hominis]QOC30368.1 hypothetical protein IC744_06870 [Microbacterium hominis]